MQNKQEANLYKMLGVIFIMAVIYTLVVINPNCPRISFSFGYLIGRTFGKLIYYIWFMNLIFYWYKEFKKRKRTSSRVL